MRYVRIYADPLRHVVYEYGLPDDYDLPDDPRLGFTRCGRRFFWSASDYDWQYDPVKTRARCEICAGYGSPASLPT